MHAKIDLDELKDALSYFNMAELKETCIELRLPFQGQKSDLINRIIIFLQTGKILKTIPLPSISKAQKNTIYPLAPQTRILSGSYKNDAVTRAFMKSLIGNHFHFTAFGQDWIKEKWREGKPPNYAEFATFWQKEYKARKNRKATPKKEWAYLNFIQKYAHANPHLSKSQVIKAWKIHRQLQIKKAKEILRRLS